MKNKLALHIFRRDLRLEDNTSLIEALKNSESVIPCFIFEKKQIEKNPFRSDNLVQFMINSLKDLSNELKNKGGKIFLFYGNTHKIIEELITKKKVDAIYINKDYTPFSLERDKKIKEICEKNKINFYEFEDCLINPPGSILKDDGKPYTIFTPFYRKSMQYIVKGPQKNNFSNYFKSKIDFEEDEDIFKKILPEDNKNIFLKGGRKEALEILKSIKKLKNYKSERDVPSKNSTSHLSAHNKFGTVSIREVYQKMTDEFGKDATIISELYWRDFFTHIAYHFPHVLGQAFHKKYNKINWSESEINFKKWCSGKTGFPIVDAGMRELNTTGYMHNRVRMIVASFLVKDLHIDWRKGERYFAQKLIDYDPAVNNGNWQWAASTGCDAQPYFRIFNPWLQAQRFDPECIYIKKWIPELNEIKPKEIHDISKKPLSLKNYPDPIVDHSIQSKIAKDLYSSI